MQICDIFNTDGREKTIKKHNTSPLSLYLKILRVNS